MEPGTSPTVVCRPPFPIPIDLSRMGAKDVGSSKAIGRAPPCLYRVLDIVDFHTARRVLRGKIGASYPISASKGRHLPSVQKGQDPSDFPRATDRIKSALLTHFHLERSTPFFDAKGSRRMNFQKTYSGFIRPRGGALKAPREFFSHGAFFKKSIRLRVFVTKKR